MKKKISVSTLIFTILFLVGLSVVLYPTVANWWNNNMASHSISTYKESVAQMDNSDNEELFEAARKYNEQLYSIFAPFTNFDQIKGYDDLLNISGTGIMGYISIPSIKVELPIYHGTSEGVLQIASGHIQGSSLPVGGENTHAVISGHRGLKSARLFTDLDKMVVGDTFTINILNEVLTYEVEKILIIEPDETDKLAVIPDGDYVTLMTCTPYGINSHRLLIRSHRIETEYQNRLKISADAVMMDRMKVVPFIAVPIILILVIFWFVTSGRKHGDLPINPKYKI